MARYVKDGRAVIIDAMAQIDAFKAAGWVEEQEPEEVEPKPKRTRKAKADE